MQIRVSRRSDLLFGGVEIRLFAAVQQNTIEQVGKSTVFKPSNISCQLTIEELKPEDIGRSIPPALSFSPDEAQQLADQLWEAGVRPSNSVGSVGQLEATRNHLEDMRKLVFHSLDISKQNSKN